MTETHGSLLEQEGSGKSFKWIKDDKYLAVLFEPPEDPKRIAHLQSEAFPGAHITTPEGKIKAILHLASLFGRYRDTQETAARNFYERQAQSTTEPQSSAHDPSLSHESGESLRTEEELSANNGTSDAFYMTEAQLDQRFGTDLAKLFMPPSGEESL